MTIINFTIEGVSYQAEEGMTWAQWVGSAYNEDGFYLQGTGSVLSSIAEVLCNPGAATYLDNPAAQSDEIQANTAYLLLPPVVLN